MQTYFGDAVSAHSSQNLSSRAVDRRACRGVTLGREMDLNSSEDEEGPTPAGPGPSTAAAAPIAVIDLCDDDTPIVAHSPEADDAALARRLQAEEYGELPPEDWGQVYGAQPASSGGGTSKRAPACGSTSKPAKRMATPRARVGASSGSTGEREASCEAPTPPPKQPYSPAASVYTQSLDAALDAALAAVAADGAPLFAEAERHLLCTARSLDAAPRCLLARLLYLKEPWHACARLTSYVQQVP